VLVHSTALQEHSNALSTRKERTCTALVHSVLDVGKVCLIALQGVLKRTTDDRLERRMAGLECYLLKKFRQLRTYDRKRKKKKQKYTKQKKQRKRNKKLKKKKKKNKGKQKIIKLKLILKT
jgi:hypothetical protein